MDNILVAIDFSDITNTVIEKANTLAKALKSQVTVLHVAAPEPDFVGYSVGPQYIRDERAEELRSEHQSIEKVVRGLQNAGIDASGLLFPGHASEMILEKANELSSDLIIMGSHGHSAAYDLLVGSVSKEVLQKSKVPVMVVPGNKK